MYFVKMSYRMQIFLFNKINFENIRVVLNEQSTYATIISNELEKITVSLSIF